MGRLVRSAVGPDARVPVVVSPAIRATGVAGPDVGAPGSVAGFGGSGFASRSPEVRFRSRSRVCAIAGRSTTGGSGSRAAARVWPPAAIACWIASASNACDTLWLRWASLISSNCTGITMIAVERASRRRILMR